LQPRIKIFERTDPGNGLFDVDPKGIAATGLSYLSS